MYNSLKAEPETENSTVMDCISNYPTDLINLSFLQKNNWIRNLENVYTTSLINLFCLLYISFSINKVKLIVVQ